MNVLVICDDRWHPGEVVRAGVDPLQNKGFEFDFIFDASEFTEDKIKNYPVIIFSKSNNISSTNTDTWVTSEVENEFTKYVKNGGGLLVIHSGTAGYKENIMFSKLLGGVFEHHPEQCNVIVETIKNNPIIYENIEFTIFDEHYFMNMKEDIANVFMTTTSKNGKQPGGWIRTEGEGRICVITPGHNLEVWLNKDFQNILRSSLNWCAKER
ncbi:MAG: ThuA domain-containing protein [Clostridiaceae bacterium]|nr:ThuA domain-containing protein [Clostridiaceae bacterium]